jgi:hypothetical protein
MATSTGFRNPAGWEWAYYSNLFETPDRRPTEDGGHQVEWQIRERAKGPWVRIGTATFDYRPTGAVAKS